jgi:hypothetical protein
VTAPSVAKSRRNAKIQQQSNTSTCVASNPAGGSAIPKHLEEPRKKEKRKRKEKNLGCSLKRYRGERLVKCGRIKAKGMI